MQRFLVRSLFGLAAATAAISTPAALWNVFANLNGLNEVPPNPSSATGFSGGTYDDVTRELVIHTMGGTFMGPTIGAHIHRGAAGVNGAIAVFLSGTTGTTFYMSDDTVTLSASDGALLLSGGLYVNIHSTVWPGGEIRGQFVATPVGVTVTGTVELQDWMGPYAGRTVEIEVRNAGTNTLVHSQTVALDSSGHYAFNTSAFGNGTYAVYAKASHWLRKKRANIVVPGGTTGVNFSLVNGDCDDDNEVAIGDFGLLSSAFGSEPGDGNWDAEADLNGDDGVDIGDYAILSIRFGMVGD
jgi:hypothetical protein